MNVAIQRILFPTDFSEAARQAQNYAMALAERFGAELHLLNVIPPIPAPALDADIHWAPLDTAVMYDIDATKAILTEQVGAQWIASHPTIPAVEIGFVVDEIINYAKKNHIDLIVVGTHGQTGLSRLLLGSVTEKVVRLADCPVLTVHPKGHQFLVENPAR